METANGGSEGDQHDTDAVRSAVETANEGRGGKMHNTDLSAVSVPSEHSATGKATKTEKFVTETIEDVFAKASCTDVATPGRVTVEKLLHTVKPSGGDPVHGIRGGSRGGGFRGLTPPPLPKDCPADSEIWRKGVADRL